MYKVSINQKRLRQRMIEEDKNSLIRALKKDDPKAAKQALTGMSGEDLGLDSKSFNQLAKEIEWVNNSDHNRDTKGQPANLDNARQLLKVGKDVKQTTDTHNPVTNQPWSSGPVKLHGKNVISLTPQELDILKQYRKSAMGLKSFNYGDLSQIAMDTMYDDPTDVGDGLRYKIIDFVRKAYPLKYKDSDFPDI